MRRKNCAEMEIYMNWLAENMGTIVVAIIVFGFLFMAVRQVVNDRKKGCNSCGMNCSGCGHSCGSQEIPERFKLKK